MSASGSIPFFKQPKKFKRFAELTEAQKKDAVKILYRIVKSVKGEEHYHVGEEHATLRESTHVPPDKEMQERVQGYIDRLSVFILFVPVKRMHVKHQVDGEIVDAGTAPCVRIRAVIPHLLDRLTGLPNRIPKKIKDHWGELPEEMHKFVIKSLWVGLEELIAESGSQPLGDSQRSPITYTHPHIPVIIPHAECEDKAADVKRPYDLVTALEVAERDSKHPITRAPFIPSGLIPGEEVLKKLSKRAMDAIAAKSVEGAAETGEEKPAKRHRK